jgi:alpha-1,3-rhamnosyl/mannosyltransferase
LGGDRIPLVFAGAKGWLMDDFSILIRKMGLEENVVITGYVTDDELIWLYNNCYSNLYPSFYEGFGLPVLEGMQFGASSIISNTTSLPEIGNSAAIYQSPEDTFGWATCMFNLRSNPLKNAVMRIDSKKNALKFGWEQSASSIIDLYKESLVNSKR